MNINELINLTEKRVQYYTRLLNSSQQDGDIEAVNKYQELLDITQDTLDKLKSL